jgi:hypothetical protein
LLVVLGGEWRKLKEIADSGSVDALSLSLSHSLSPNVFEIASLGFIFVVAKGKKEKPIRLRCWLLRGRTNKKGSKTRRRILLGVKNHLYLKQEESYLGKREREKEREREREREGGKGKPSQRKRLPSSSSSSIPCCVCLLYGGGPWECYFEMPAI